MLRVLLPVVLFLVVSARAQVPSQDQGPSPVNEALGSVLTEDQLQGLDRGAGLKERISLMTPEQKKAALPKLQAIEAANPGPKILAELHSAYELLGRHKDAQRAALAVQKAKPRQSTGFTLAARSFNLEGDYPRAVEQARAALKINPDDMNAWTVLKLSEGRVPCGPSSSTASPALSAKGELQRSEDGGPLAAEAMAFMRRAIEERKTGVFADVLASAQAAMRADPGSRTVADFYRMVIDDRAKNIKAVKIQERLALMEKAAGAGRAEEALVHAEKLYALDPNPETNKLVEIMRARVPKKPAPARKTREDIPAGEAAAQEHGAIPPAVPIGAGGLLLALGGLGWGLWGRDRAEAWWRDVKLSAATGAVILGTAGVIYGGYLMFGAFQATPTLGLAGGGAAVPAVAVDGVAVVEGAAVAAGSLKMASDGYSNVKDQSKARSRKNQGATHQNPGSSLKKPNAQNRRLQRAIDQLFRPTDKTPGGTAGAVRREFFTGEPTGGRWHLKKALENTARLNRILQEESLSPADRATAKALRDELQSAVDLYHRGAP